MRNMTSLIFFVLILGFFPKLEAYGQCDISAEACVLMYEDGQCIYQKNADEKHLIASTTKLMTAIVALENSRLDGMVKIKPEHCMVEGSSMYLKAGEKYTVKELLLGLLLASGNDAALALAEYVSGDVKEFAALMNDKAKEIGMNDTSFSNPHGLDARAHYSTAMDMARLMLYCMQNEEFCSLVSCYDAKIKGEYYVNHNKLLKTYPGCVGGKTGFTAAAGRCLVSCAERNGMRYVCVTLSAPDDWNDHAKLYDYAFENFVLRDLSEEISFEVPVISGSKDSVSLTPDKPLKLFLNKNEKIEYNAEIPIFIFAPVKIGETAGKICVIIKNNVVTEIPLVYAEDIVMAYPCLNMAAMEVLI